MRDLLSIGTSRGCEMIGTGIGLGLSGFMLNSPWNPKKINGLQFWLDASDSSTLFTDSALTTLAVSDGDAVGGWKDKSGNSLNALQADGTKKPTLKTGVKNSRNVVRFDGVNDFLANDNSFTFKHIFCVLYLNTSSTVATALGADEFDVGSNPVVIIRRNASNGWSYSDVNDWTASSNIRVNGAATSTQDNLTWSIISAPRAAGYTKNFILSARFTRFFSGDFAEVLVYSDVLTGSNLTDVENYLKTKWGTP